MWDRGYFLVVCVAWMVCTGCQTTKDSIESSQIGLDQGRREQQLAVSYMRDNALISDLSLAEIHFVPHTSMLNSLGERRLSRYAYLLGTRGGVLHVEFRQTFDELQRQQRLDEVADFLADAGIEEGRIVVQAGISQGHRLTATEAIEIKDVHFAPPERTSTLTDLMGGGTGGALGSQ